MLDERTVFLVPACDADPDGELTAQGVRQSFLIGDALGDKPLRAIYTSPEQAAVDTAEATAQRHGLALRRKPTLAWSGTEPFEAQAERILTAFESIARAGPGRTSLVVAHPTALQIVVAHCCGLAPREREPRQMARASITEITVEETRYVIEHLERTDHLGAGSR